MNKKGLFHGLLMMACCLIPILALAAFMPQLQNSASGFNWAWLFILACPLMHIFMMKGMMGHGKNHDHEESGKDIRTIEKLPDSNAEKQS